MTETELILKALDQTRTEVKADIKELFSLVDSMRVGAATVSTEFEGHVKACETRHRNDGNLMRSIGEKALWAVIYAAIIFMGIAAYDKIVPADTQHISVNAPRVVK